MYLQHQSVKEPSKNLDIWIRVLLSSLQDGGSVWVLAHCLLSGLGSVQFLVKPGFWFGSFLLCLASFPSLLNTLTIMVIVVSLWATLL